MESFEFKRKSSFEKRITESGGLLKKHADRVPIICEPAPTCKLPRIDSTKFIVPRSIKVIQFLAIIRKRLPNIHPTKAVFFLVDDKIIKMDITISELYEEYSEADGFLYIMYKDEDVFG